MTTTVTGPTPATVPSLDDVRAAVRAELAVHVPPRMVGVADAARALGISESAAWQLVGSGTLRSVKVGRRRLIPIAALDEFVERAETAGVDLGEDDAA